MSKDKNQTKTELFQKMTSFVIRNKVFFISFAVLFAVYLVWWMAFYPAVMTSDSFEMWAEVLKFHFKNSNPFSYGLIMFLVTRIFPSPSMMALFQLTLFSAIVSYFTNYAWKRKVEPYILVLFLALFIVWPQFGVYNVTIWKDVMYAITSLAAGLMTFYFMMKREEGWGKYDLLLLSIVLAMPSLFRFNGFFFLFVPVVLLFILRVINIKKAFLILAGTLVTFFLITTVLANLIKVQQVPAMSEGLMIKAIGGVYHVNANLTPFEKKSFEAFMPESDWRRLYDCQSANILVQRVMKLHHTNSYSPRLDPNVEEDNNFRSAFLSATLKNPQGIIYDRACLANNLLGVMKVNNFRYSDSIIRGYWQPMIKEASLWPQAKEFLKKYMVWTTATKHRSDVFWATWPPLIALAFAGVYVIWKKLPGTILFILLILLNVSVVIALVPAIDYRYVYFVYVCTPFVPILYFIESRQKTTNTPKPRQ